MMTILLSSTWRIGSCCLSARANSIAPSRGWRSCIWTTQRSVFERAVRMTLNAAAHKALGRAYVENGRETDGYAELVIALLLDPTMSKSPHRARTMAFDGGPAGTICRGARTCGRH